MVVRTDTSDYELLEMIGDKDDPFSQEAFKEFHRRHKDFIFGSCYDFFRPWPPEEARARASDLSQDTLHIVLRKAQKFAPAQAISSEKIVKHVRSWLYKIIRNLYLDQNVKKPKRRIEVIEVGLEKRVKAEQEFYDNSGETTGLSDEKMEKYRQIQKAVLDLKISPKQKDILNTYVESGLFDDRGNWFLPTERMDELIQRYGITKNAIIQSKNRLIQRIKDHLKQTNF